MNYVIATYNGSANRKHTHPIPNDVLRCHIDKIREFKHNLKRITIMKAKCDKPVYENYYNINKTGLPIKEINVENYGYSMGQWLKAYELDKTFDYYLFMEDDYCPSLDNFDKIIIKIYKDKFPDNIGLLTSVIEGKGMGEDGSYPIHFEGIALVSRETLEKLYKKWDNKAREELDKLDSTVVKCLNDVKRRYKGGYYQLTFSLIFTLAGIEHKDYTEIYNHFYWDDFRNLITKFNRKKKHSKRYTLDDIRNCVFLPVQLKDEECIKKHAKFA